MLQNNELCLYKFSAESRNFVASAKFIIVHSDALLHCVCVPLAIFFCVLLKCNAAISLMLAMAKINGHIIISQHPYRFQISAQAFKHKSYCISFGAASFRISAS